MSDDKPTPQSKLNCYGLTASEWDKVVDIGVTLHNALIEEPEGEDWYDGQSLSIMVQLVRAFKAGKDAGIAQSQNYVADDAFIPEKITFANGRKVKIVSTKAPGVHNGVYLEVE